MSKISVIYIFKIRYIDTIYNHKTDNYSNIAVTIF